MKGLIFVTISAALTEDSELVLHEDVIILTDIYCHTDSRMAPLTELNLTAEIYWVQPSVWAA